MCEVITGRCNKLVQFSKTMEWGHCEEPLHSALSTKNNIPFRMTEGIRSDDSDVSPEAYQILFEKRLMS